MIDVKFDNGVLMDYVRLELEVRKKALTYLDEINEENLKSFTEDVKFVAQSVLEDYFFSIDNLCSEGIKRLTNEDNLDRFLDFHDGYRAKMKKWSNDHKIEIRQINVSLVKYPQMKTTVGRKLVLIAGIGSAVVVMGLFVFTDIWIFVAAELLMLGIAVYIYKKECDSCKKEYAFKIKQYEIQKDQQRAKFVNGLIVDLKKWLKQAENYSNNILVTFGIN